MTTQTVTHPIPPLYDDKSHTLILGTMPSPASRERSFFYMHTTNRFWPVLALLFSKQLRYSNKGVRLDNKTGKPPDLDAAIAERKSLALRNGIALWDVLAQCDISGAADYSITNPVPNDFTAILTESSINRIFCTGKTAYQLYLKYEVQTVREKTGKDIPVICLPSTSAANQSRWPLEKLVAAYAVLVQPY